jgi:hypothetical protein
MQQLSDILKEKQLLDKDTRNKYEFQAYGNRLAEELNDKAHRSLYIKMAKTEDRNILEAARLHALGAENITQKGKLFMWKLKQLKQGTK